MNKKRQLISWMHHFSFNRFELSRWCSERGNWGLGLNKLNNMEESVGWVQHAYGRYLKSDNFGLKYVVHVTKPYVLMCEPMMNRLFCVDNSIVFKKPFWINDVRIKWGRDRHLHLGGDGFTKWVLNKLPQLIY